MRPLREWFGLTDPTDEDGWKYHWYNWSREYYPIENRVRVDLGDLLRMNQEEGGGYAGGKFAVELEIAQPDLPIFYFPDNEKAEYDVHIFTAMFWRWGICVWVRGRVT